MPQPLAVTAFMASPGRFELPAPRLGGVCSIQLSYGDIFNLLWSRMEQLASQDFDDLIIRRRSLYPAELRRRTFSCIPFIREETLLLSYPKIRKKSRIYLYLFLKIYFSHHPDLPFKPASHRRFAEKIFLVDSHIKENVIALNGHIVNFFH